VPLTDIVRWRIFYRPLQLAHVSRRLELKGHVAALISVSEAKHTHSVASLRVFQPERLSRRIVACVGSGVHAATTASMPAFGSSL
jgi:hypothetical protein